VALNQRGKQYEIPRWEATAGRSKIKGFLVQKFPCANGGGGVQYLCVKEPSWEK